MTKRSAWENNLNQHRVPNAAKYRSCANRPTVFATFVNNTRFDGPDGCWIWVGTVTDDGYGQFNDYAFGGLLAHRLSLYLDGQEVPPDKVVDHRCHKAGDCIGATCMHRRCVNPAHLAIVDPAENILRGNGAGARNARKTHCINGHEFDEVNTGYAKPRSKSGRPSRYCKACARSRAAARAA